MQTTAIGVLCLSVPGVCSQVQPALVQPLSYVQRPDTDSKALSNIELLIPLVVGEPAARRERVRGELDERFSSIPAYAFTLDEAAPAQASGSRKRELSRQLPRMRSAYLPDEDDGRGVWRACGRLASARAGAAREALLFLCAELLAPAPPAPDTPCACCNRRDLNPMGDHPDM
ncbi:unnamed protein product [Chrysodeixis includens]|uniref:Uncharacterized protein n=1 Tax=Chrysodeixis includens TaxID=689277 RepID=A0A9N8Q0T4_CHRIL|nr:unnamed protein product [Chrysodeixis includens]